MVIVNSTDNKAMVIYPGHNDRLCGLSFMWKSVLFLSVFLGVVIGGVAQTSSDVPNLEPNRILLPSPNAATINKGADASVNLSTGTPSVGIPFYTINSRSLSLPISINYASNGIRVNELASNVGLGWSLNCGGAISRIVLGKPDEKRAEWGQVLDNFNTDFHLLNRAVFDFAMEQTLADRESDLFSINMNGLDAKFIMDANNEPASLNTTNLRIKKLGATLTSGFQVTDENGIVYTFDAVETNATIESGYQGPKPFPDPLPTSWYLTSIIKPNQDTIQLSYSYYTHTYLANLSELFTILWDSQETGGPCSNPPPPLKTNTYNCGITSNKIEGKALSHITFTNGSVDFGYTNRKDGGGLALNGIYVKNNQGQIVKQMVLEQDYFSSTDINDSFLKGEKKIGSLDTTLKYRLYLSECKIAGNSLADTSKLLRYKFDYIHGNDLPVRMSGAQDYYGYYNGKLSNEYQMPDVSYQYPGIYNNMPAGKPRFGDRTPDTTLMTYGMLKTITYPTGGYDSIGYSYNKGPDTKIVHHFQHENLITHGSGFTGTVTITQNITIPFYQPVIAYTNVNFDTYNPDCNYDPIHQKATFTIKDAATLSVIATRGVGIDKSDSLSLWLNPGQYILSLTVVGGCTIGSVDFVLENQEADTIPIIVPIGAVSVSSITSYTDSGTKALKRLFNYMNLKDSSISTFGVYFSKNMYEKVKTPFFPTCSGGTPCSSLANLWYVNIGNNIVMPTTTIGGSSTYHSSIIETIEGLGEVQTTEHIFSFNGILNSSIVWNNRILGTPRCAYGDFMIGETKTNMYKRILSPGVDSLQLIKSIENVYDLLIKGNVFNYNVRKLASPPCKTPEPNDQDLISLDIEKYPLVFMRKRLQSTTERTYASDNSGKLVEKMLTYSYINDTNRVMIRDVSENQSDGKVQSMAYTYPLDLKGTSAVYDSMINRNMIAPIISLTKKVGTGQMDQKTVSYMFTRSDKQIIAFQNLKEQIVNNPTEDRVSVISYTSKGNIQEKANANDVREVYLWGYNEQFPVAKIVGSTYDTVMKYIAPAYLTNTDSYTPDQLRTALNGIRTSLPQALVTTFTYTPLFGMTSETDPSGKTIYYEYDEMGRLKVIRDQNKSVLKQFDYQYQSLLR
ncbi:RHS repeat domain-containing protein [Chitinophaga eiseniae]|uniref:RHS repeat protein n=1 Tax=Chitinophaga eiseniae TaxID=634771 RepID=A0A847SHW3_9BACT|nr:RHS repeat domain-containing protein [Chitinophaga eiseniae]NLR79734.1 RHS repeat protein [Chitinophaga eiseniae]